MLACIIQNKRPVLAEVEQPSCAQGEILGKVLATSICGTDLRTYRNGAKNLAEGRIIGHEVVLEVIESKSESFQPGDVVQVAPAIGCGVCCMCQKGLTNMCNSLQTIGFEHNGAFAQFIAIPAQAIAMGNCTKLTGTLPPSLYVLAEPLACVINSHSFLNIQKGDSVAIFGAGIIGCMHAQLARHAGAKDVVIIEPNASRRAQVSAVMPDVECMELEDAKAYLQEHNTCGGADVAIIACSIGPAQRDGMNLLNKQGRISLFGGLPGESTGFIDSNLIHYRQLSVFGVHASTAQNNRDAIRMIEQGSVKLENLISQYPLSQIQQAFADLVEGKVMKCVLAPN